MRHISLQISLQNGKQKHSLLYSPFKQQEEFLDSAKSGVNRYHFIHFLARNAVMEQTTCKVKGYTVSLQVGQVAFAEGELARLFGCERKTIQRLVES